MKRILLALLLLGYLVVPGYPQLVIVGGGSGGGTPGGANTQCQYNNNGAFGGITGCTTNGTAVTLVAPVLGTPASGVATNLSGTAAGLTAGNVTGTGVGSLTSLALGGATIGSNALAVTGTALFSSSIKSTSYVGTAGGNPWVDIGNSAVTLAFDLALQWASSANASGATDLKLYRDGAANTLAQRNGTAAQRNNLYNTWTDASNYEQAYFWWTGNKFYIQTNQAGTGLTRGMGIGTVGASSLDLLTNDTIRWTVNSSGHFLAGTHNTYDIGTSVSVAAPRNIYAAGIIQAGGSVQAGSASDIFWSSRSSLRSPSDGVIGLYNNNANDFTRLQFGGITDSFVALKRSGTSIIVTGGADGAVGGLTANGPTQGLGYSTGAGGTVTQATSRTTGVTLNKVTGQVTTTADSIAAITIVTFTVTNSAVAATDTIILSKVSGDVDTSAFVSAVAAGSFNVSLRNNDAVSADTTAFVFNFAVIKGVSS